MVVTVGLAVTLAPVVALSPVPGLHVYDVAPDAFSVVELPLQMVALPTVGVTDPPTVTVAVAVAVHPAAEVPVMVYVVVTVGLALTELPVDALSEEAGVHVYVLAPPAVSVAPLPGHIVAEFTVIVGVGLTVTVDEAVVVHPATEVPVMV